MTIPLREMDDVEREKVLLDLTDKTYALVELYVHLNGGKKRTGISDLFEEMQMIFDQLEE